MKFLTAAFLAGLAVQNAGPIYAKVTSATAPNRPVDSRTSYNWAGYVSDRGTFTAVEGTWIVPEVKNIGMLCGNAEWVGIGGVSGDDLIQAGTQAIAGESGKTTYRAWYELLPASSRKIPVNIKPGDSVSVSVKKRSGNDWTIFFKNNTSGENHKITVVYDSSESTAEWIEEMPSLDQEFLPLDDFGTVKFSGGSAVKNGESMNISESNAKALTMINDAGQTLARPSKLSGDGSGFTVTRTSAHPKKSANSNFLGGSLAIKSIETMIRAISR